MTAGIPNGGEYPEISEAFGNWFAGFVDGEGCFYIGENGCAFYVHMRADDLAALQWIKDELRIGRIHFVKKTGSNSRNASVRFEVSRKLHCVWLTGFFEAFPLHTKKQRDYAIWRQAAIAHHMGALPAELKPYREAMTAARKFSSPNQEKDTSDA